MGSKIEFGPGSLYITDEDGNKRPLGDVGTIELISDRYQNDIPIKRYEGDYTFNATVNLTFRGRVKLFGFWNTIKTMIRSAFKRGD